MNEATGFETMSSAIAEIRHYYDWLYHSIHPYLGETILEIGPGFGNIAERILKSGKRYSAVDTDAGIISRLAARFPQLPSDQLVVGDITNPELLAQMKSQHPDCVLSMNVLEHIEDDRAHVKAISSGALAPRFIFVVPAMEFLYGTFDSEAGHFRRYTKSTLTQVLQSAGMKVVHMSYFNAMGALSWWAATRVLKMKLNGSGSQRAILLYDRLFIPLARLGDPLLSKFLGQSLIAVATPG